MVSGRNGDTALNMDSSEKKIIAYTSISHGFCHVFELAYGVLLIGIGREFGIGLFVLGVLANISGLAFGLSALPIGYLSDKIGERRLLTIYCFTTALASIAVGLSPSTYVLAITLFFLGLAIGIYHPTGSALVARRATHRGSAFGWLGMGGNLGVALGPALASFLAAPLSWRAPYLIYAVPMLILAVLLYRFSREELPEPARVPVAGGSAKRANTSIGSLIFVLCAGAANGLAYRGLVTFLPTHFIDRLEFSLLGLNSIILAGSFTTVALIFGAAGQVLAGQLCEKKRTEILAVLFTIPVVPLLLLVGLAQGPALLLSAIILSFFFFAWQPICNNLIASYSPSSWRGLSYGIGFSVNFGLGSFSTSLLGFIAERSDTNWVFITLAGIALVVVVLVIPILIRSYAGSKDR